MSDRAASEYWTLDILVNNAGIMDGFEPTGDNSNENLERYACNTQSIAIVE